MNSVIRFLGLASALLRLRVGPQDMPPGAAVAWQALAIYGITGVIVVMLPDRSLATAFAVVLADLLLWLGLLTGGLMASNKSARLAQSVTAVAIAGLLFGLLGLCYLFLGQYLFAEDSLVYALLGLALMLWTIAVLAHIVKHSFDVSAGLAVAIAIAYYFASVTLYLSIIEAPSSIG